MYVCFDVYWEDIFWEAGNFIWLFFPRFFQVVLIFLAKKSQQPEKISEKTQKEKNGPLQKNFFTLRVKTDVHK